MSDEIITPAYLDPTRENKAILNYILENCVFAYDELCKVNKELVAGMSLDSNADVNHLGAMNRMIQDYLIVRVEGLFDKTEHRTSGGDDEVISFDKLFLTNQDYLKIREEKIIKYIIEQRHNFVAHTNKSHIENNFPITAKICSSNLKELLENLRNLLKN